MRFSIYRYNPEDAKPKPYIQELELDISKCKGVMLLDALIALKAADETLSFRRACGEGVCGSSAMNINGRNGLACITPLSSLQSKKTITLRPLPGMPVIRDLIIDLTNFINQYKKVKPFLQTSSPEQSGERLQTPEQRQELDGLYECILCACCTSACPSYWWNPDKFLGPAALLQSARFVKDSRDSNTSERLEQLNDSYSVFRCRTIMNCVDVCPKGLNPTKAINQIRQKMLEENA